jgi:DNA-binding MarR family transcriptional regulator
MTIQDQGTPDAAAAKERRRKSLERAASVDQTEALESMLINAHRVATTLGELSIFRDTELSVAEWALLKSLGDRQNVPLRKISTLAGVSRQRLRKVVSDLEVKSLVSTSRAKTDKRTRMISATPLAAKVLALVSQRMRSLFPDTNEKTGKKILRGRSFVGGARSMDRVAKAMRRQWLPRRQRSKRSAPEAGLAGR